jgi:hypothetical protein
MDKVSSDLATAGGLTMRSVLRGSILALAIAPVCLHTAFGQTARQPAAAKAKEMAAFDPHDISGVWYRVSPIQTFSNVNNVQPDLPPNLAGARGRGTVFEEAPFTPAGKAALEKKKPGYGPRVVPPAFGNDPMGTCDPLGIPRNLNAEVGSSHTTWQIVQTADRMFQYFQWHHDYRVVWADGRSLPTTDDFDPKWNGYSVGHWAGNTFVVDSIGFDARTWLDKFGYPHTEQMKLQERYRRLDHDTLELTMTLTDPEYYTRPWVSDTKIFKLNASPIKEFPTGEPFIKNWDQQVYCVPSEEYKFNQGVRDTGAGKSGTQ